MRQYDEELPGKIRVFWGEVAPSQHLMQVYQHEHTFLDKLECFTKCGLLAKEGVAVIAPERHMLALELRLWRAGLDPEKLATQGLYLPASAEDTLRKFMIKDWPDEKLFRATISEIVGQLKPTNVRICSEMVAVLWANELSGATVHLEHLWSNFIREENLSLFCAFPKSGFTQDPHVSLLHILDLARRVASKQKKAGTEIYSQADHAVAETPGERTV